MFTRLSFSPNGHDSIFAQYDLVVFSERGKVAPTFPIDPEMPKELHLLKHHYLGNQITNKELYNF